LQFHQEEGHQPQEEGHRGEADEEVEVEEAFVQPPFLIDQLY
jgi:hypothetical protein